MKNTLAHLLVVLGISLAAPPVGAQGFPFGEWGDAPDGWTAYWDNGNGGNFPTCLGGGFIFHASHPFPVNCYFGMSYDDEFDGNASTCFEPYDRDECAPFLDGDAGLFMPTAYSYGPTRQPIVCSGFVPTDLGQTCRKSRWGTDIDIGLTNNIGPGVPAYFNVLVDWDRSGDWSPFPVGPNGCGSQLAEHVVRNLPVPPGFTGLASQLGLTDFQCGPDSGLVWVRFTITESPVLFPFDGSGFFEFGETEDYMLRIAPAPIEEELGDAPYGVVAYPGGTVGQFPTCQSSPGFVHHPAGGLLFLGSGIDYESDGNHNACAFQPYDHDECYQDGDAGLVNPPPFSLDAVTQQVQPCNAPPVAFARACNPIGWGADIDLQITNNQPTPAYLNMLVDWDHDGRWLNAPAGCPGGFPIEEHVIANLAVPPGTNGLLSSLGPPPSVAGGAGYAWVRFTVSDTPAPINWDGGGNMGFGETEDYLLLVGGGLSGVGGNAATVTVGEPWPNPARGPVRLAFSLPGPAAVGISVHDISGRRIRDLGHASRAGGPHVVEWDGNTAAGRPAPAGMYLVHVRVGAALHVKRVIMLR